MLPAMAVDFLILLVLVATPVLLFLPLFFLFPPLYFFFVVIGIFLFLTYAFIFPVAYVLYDFIKGTPGGSTGHLLSSSWRTRGFVVAMYSKFSLFFIFPIPILFVATVLCRYFDKQPVIADGVYQGWLASRNPYKRFAATNLYILLAGICLALAILLALALLFFLSVVVIGIIGG